MMREDSYPFSIAALALRRHVPLRYATPHTLKSLHSCRTVLLSCRTGYCNCRVSAAGIGLAHIEAAIAMVSALVGHVEFALALPQMLPICLQATMSPQLRDMAEQSQPPSRCPMA